ncbi:hypothetical protein PSTT_05022, partial [Puccinia striiformis]
FKAGGARLAPARVPCACLKWGTRDKHSDHHTHSQHRSFRGRRAMKIPVTVTRKHQSTTVSIAKTAKGLVKSETIIVELQGVLESSSKDLESDDPQAALEGAEIGLLDMSNPEKPVLRIGNHELEGKSQKKYPGIDESENQAGGTKVTTNRFDIVDIIERKIIFSKRPQPIVAILN